MTPEAARSPIRQTVWLLTLIGAVTTLHLAGRGALAPPPIDLGADLSAWADAADPLTIALSLVRLAAEIAGLYLIGITVLYLAGRGARASRATSLADALATPATRRLLRGGLGLGLVTSGVIGSVTADVSATNVTMSTLGHQAAAASATDGTATMTPRVEQDPIAERNATATMRPLPEVSPGTATMRPLPTGAAEPTAGTATMVPTPSARPEPAPVARTHPLPAATWTVDPGDTLWSIASETLEAHHGAAPSTADIDPYWRLLIEVNQSRLVDPDEPDLIVPGQVFELPALPTAAA